MKQLSLLSHLGMTLPVIQGPMTGSDTAQLAAAVSQGGALGMLGCGMRAPQAMRQAAEQVRALTEKPFGMNLFVLQTPQPTATEIQAAMQRLAPLYAELGVEQKLPAQWCEDFDAQLNALIDAHPAVASFTFGILSRAQVQRLHDSVGCLVVGTATTLEEALAWQQVGADAVCVSGLEAGGHRGTFLGDYAASMVSTLALLPQCVDALQVPVIAAGGIMDGRGIAAAQALGAQAVQMGTAFLACPESAIGPAQRAAMAAAKATDTRTTAVFSGRPARGIVNTLMQRLLPDEAQTLPYPLQNALMADLRRAAAAQGRADFQALWAGQGVAAARAMPAAQLLQVLRQEWLQARQRLAL